MRRSPPNADEPAPQPMVTNANTPVQDEPARLPAIRQARKTQGPTPARGAIVAVPARVLAGLGLAYRRRRRACGAAPAPRPWFRRRGVVALELLLVAGALAVALVATVLWPSGGSPSASFTPAVLGQPPPGSVVQAKEDGELAVALAAKPQAGKLLLVATVLSPDGPGVAGLDSSFTVTTGGGTVQARGRACSPGCYEALVPTSGRPAAAAVTLAGNGRSSTVRFRLPARWPPRSGAALVRKAEAAYRLLRTLVTHERLASDPRHAVTTTYWAVAPNRLRYQIRGGGESIVIGGTRWDRQPGQKRWTRSAQAPFRTVAPFWTAPVADASLLGSATFRGRATWVVSFATPQVPAWFTVWLDKRTSRTLQLRMTAAAHFMHHVYGPFDSPIAIEPPR